MKLISAKIMQGAFWNAVAQYGSQLIYMASLVVLARMLVPADFGGVSMALLVISFLAIFCEAGFVSALIQKKDLTLEDRCVAFWAQLALSASICVVMLFAAPLVALFFNDNRLIAITRWLAATLLFMPFNVIPEALETKHIRYNVIAVAELIGSAAGAAAAVIMALNHMGVWSLVGLQLIKRAARGIALMTLTRWFPLLRFSRKALAALYDIGKQFTLKNLVFYMAENVDSLLIGRMLGPAALGLYNLGYQIPSYPTMKAWNMFGAMLFPAFSMMERDSPRLKVNLLRVSWLGGFFLNPLSLAILFGAGPIVEVVLGPKWIEAVPIVQIFSFLMIALAVSLGDESLLLTVGKVSLVTRWKSAVSAAMLGAGYIAVKFGGLIGITMSFVVCSILYIAVIKYITFLALGLRWSEYFFALRTVVAVTILSALVLWTYKLVFHALSPVSFVLGEILLTALVMTPFVIRSRILDLKQRKIDLERIIAFSG